jgi:hypothetical protein
MMILLFWYQISVGRLLKLTNSGILLVFGTMVFFDRANVRVPSGICASGMPVIGDALGTACEG